MEGALFMMGGVVAVGFVLAFLDWLGRRHERRRRAGSGRG
jgi:hypothetical protein